MMLNSCYLNRLYSSITSCELSLMRGSKSYMYRRRKRPPHRYPYKRIIGHYHIPYAPKKGAAGYDCSCMVSRMNTDMFYNLSWKFLFHVPLIIKSIFEGRDFRQYV